jgi:proteasome lid subunit RPN8/RPN11
MEQEIEELKSSLFKKIIVISLAVILIVLFVTYLLTNSTVRSILEGLIESSKLQGYNIKKIDINITFSKEVLSELNKIYDENIGNEFKVCLKGYIEENSYYINEIYIPKTYEKTFNRVVAEQCSEDSLISLHSHPKKHCLFSQQDLKTFKSLKEKNEHVLLALMCERDRFNFYR